MKFTCAAFFTVLLPFAALLLWAVNMPRGAGPWISVTVNADLNDRELGKKFSGAGFEYISESTQRVLLNDFDEIKQIPLDQYDLLVEDFDPRNDAYAAKLRAFFTAGGRRRFFLKTAGRPGATAKKLGDILPSGEYRVDWNPLLPGEMPRLFHTISAACFAAAALGFMLLQRRSFFAALAVLPALGFFALAGPEGIAMGGLLAAVFSLLRGALGEYFYRAGKKGRELKFIYNAYPLELAASGVLLALYGGFCIVGCLSPAAVPGFIAFIPALLLPPWLQARRARHMFFPLPVKRPAFASLFPPVLPVFTAAFFAAIIAGSFETPENSPGAGSWGTLPGRQEWESHAAYQRNFSLNALPVKISLEGYSPGRSKPYGSYTSEGGLIDGFIRQSRTDHYEYNGGLAELENLAPGKPQGNYGDRALMAVMLLLSLPFVFRLPRRCAARRQSAFVV
jgi:hypothetical protein